MFLEAVHRLPHDSLLVVQQTELEEGVCLGRLVAFFIGDIEQIFKMLNCRVDIAVFTVGLGKLLVRLACLGFIICFFAQSKELIQELDGLFQVS